MKRIYIAGSINDDNILGALDNIRRGMRLATQVLLAGYSPWVPFFDFHFQLMIRDYEQLSRKDYHRYSMDFVDVCDAVLVVEGSEDSEGVQAEIARAIDIGIPVFHSLSEFISADKSEKQR